MKKLKSFLIVAVFFTLAGGLYAEGSKYWKTQKSEEKVEDQIDWIKDDPGYIELRKHVELIIEEEVKRKIRKKLNSDTNLDKVVEYTGEDVEDLIIDYISGKITHETLADLEKATSERALEKIEEVLSEYEETLEKSASKRQKVKFLKTEVELTDPNLMLKGGKLYYKEKLFTGDLVQTIPFTDQEIVRISYSKGLITSK